MVGHNANYSTDHMHRVSDSYYAKRDFHWKGASIQWMANNLWLLSFISYRKKKRKKQQHKNCACYRPISLRSAFSPFDVLFSVLYVKCSMSTVDPWKMKMEHFNLLFSSPTSEIWSHLWLIRYWYGCSAHKKIFRIFYSKTSMYDLSEFNFGSDYRRLTALVSMRSIFVFW